MSWVQQTKQNHTKLPQTLNRTCVYQYISIFLMFFLFTFNLVCVYLNPEGKPEDAVATEVQSNTL